TAPDLFNQVLRRSAEDGHAGDYRVLQSLAGSSEIEVVPIRRKGEIAVTSGDRRHDLDGTTVGNVLKFNGVLISVMKSVRHVFAAGRDGRPEGFAVIGQPLEFNRRNRQGRCYSVAATLTYETTQAES